MKRPPFLVFLLMLPVLLRCASVGAQMNASDSFCILPIYDVLTGGVPDATLQTEMTKLETQVGPSRNSFKIGFSHLFGSATTGGNAARMAAANNLYCGFIIALQTHDVNSTTAGDAANITLQLSGGANRLPTTMTLTLAGDVYHGAQRGWLDLNGNNQTLAGLTAASGRRGIGDDRVPNTATATNATLTIHNAADCTCAGVLGSGSGDTRNNFNLSKTGTGIFTLSGVATFTGSTSIAAGKLALVGASNKLAATPLINVAAGATLNVSGVTDDSGQVKFAVPPAFPARANVCCGYAPRHPDPAWTWRSRETDDEPL